jgi:hypothetical protein
MTDDAPGGPLITGHRLGGRAPEGLPRGAAHDH